MDFRLAFRSLLRAPMFTVIAILCLGIGIGANTTVFSAIQALLLRPLPYANSEQLVSIGIVRKNDPNERHSWSYPNVEDFGTADGAFSSVGVVTERTVNLGGIDEPVRVQGARVSSSMFPTLGIHMALGRSFRADEELAGRVAVIGYSLWMRSFNGERKALGQRVLVNGEPYTIIGVLEPQNRFPETSEIWLPLEPGDLRTHRAWSTYEMIGRLAPGTSTASAAAAARHAFDRLSTFPENAGLTTTVKSYRDLFVGDVRPVLLIMLGAVGFVLLIACANVANLLLARASVRQREIAVRAALGARRGQIVLQLLAESILLAIGGGLLGALIGTWGVDALVRALPDSIPFWMVFTVDGWVLLYTFLIALVTSIVFGLIPAWQASSPTLTASLKDGGRGSVGKSNAGRLRSTLVVAEIALSLVLLSGATLMMRSFMAMQRSNPGFRPDSVLTLGVALVGPKYDNDTTTAAFVSTLESRIGSLPGVVGVGAVGALPVASCCNHSTFVPEGIEYATDEAPMVLVNAATPGFFGALGIPILAGRGFSDHDDIRATRVAIVSQSIARQGWPKGDALNRRFHQIRDTTMFTIVGIVPDVKQREISEPNRGQIWFPEGGIL